MFRAYGVEPLEVRPAPEVEGRLIRGGQGTQLSDYEGQWVLLTFFASWCGPCRSEMPSLDRLHQSHDQLTVLGVSIDSKESEASRFVDKYRLSFPTIWDRGGVYSRQWQASSIPLSYLIDPQGQVVGRARGARDWERASPLFKALAKGEIRSEVSPLEPPRIFAEMSPPQIKAGEIGQLMIRIYWEGEPEAFRFQPPRLDSIEGLVQGRMRAISDSREGINSVLYELPLSSENAGAYALGPIEVEYVPTHGPSDRLVVAGPSIEILEVHTFPLKAATSGALSLVALSVLLFLGLRYRNSQSLVVSTEPTPEELLHDARELRLAAQWIPFLEKLNALDLSLGGDRAVGDCSSLLEKVRFGGYHPSPAEMEDLEKAVGRKLRGEDVLIPPQPTMDLRDRNKGEWERP